MSQWGLSMEFKQTHSEFSVKWQRVGKEAGHCRPPLRGTGHGAGA